MMQNWDFVDPKLARKLKQLHHQMQQLKDKRKNILENTRLASSTKNKLLAFNQQCMKDLMEVYSKNKQHFVDYFDMQTVVLSKIKKQVIAQKEEIKNRNGNSNENSNNMINNSINESFNNQNRIVKSNRNAKINVNAQQKQYITQNQKQRYLSDTDRKQESQNTTKLTFDQFDKDKSIQSLNLNLNLNLNSNSTKAKTKIRNYVNLNSSEMTDVEFLNNKQKEMNIVDNGLNTTGRLTRKKYPTRVKQTKSFELNSTTIRNKSYDTLNESKQCQKHNNSYGNTIKQSSKRHFTTKASILRIHSRRFERKLAKKQLQLQLSKLFHQDTRFVLSRLRKQSEQDKQIINLLYKKIEIIEQNKYSRQQHEIEMKEMKQNYEKQAKALQQKYLQLQKIQKQNKQLEFRRKQLLNLQKGRP